MDAARAIRYRRIERIKKKKRAAKTREILTYAGIGAFIAASIIFPGLPRVFKGRNLQKDVDNFIGEEIWEGYDIRRLKERLKVLYRRKIIRISTVGEKTIIELTENGRKRLLRYQLRDFSIPAPKKWDGKWRIVAYDIPNRKKPAREAIRATLKKLEFFQLQKSMYLYPYPCSEMIEFLRDFYDVDEQITLLTVGFLEHEGVYKEFFALE